MSTVTCLASFGEPPGTRSMLRCGQRNYQLMSDMRPVLQSSFPSPADQTFPTLTAAQIARLAVHGNVRRVEPGEVLVEAGEKISRFFVVTAGRLEGVRQSAAGEEVVTV